MWLIPEQGYVSEHPMLPSAVLARQPLRALVGFVKWFFQGIQSLIPLLPEHPHLDE